jgi:hypothetical protein
MKSSKIKILIILFSVYHISFSNAQTDRDSLIKYSYYIYGVYKGNDINHVNITQGTCFFIKYKEKTFLVSAKHVLTSWSASNSVKRGNYPDTLYVRLRKVNQNEFTFYPLDISSLKNDEKEDFYFNEPDYCFIEIKDANKFQINSIENLIFRNSEITIQNALIFGYPELDDDDFSNFRLRDASCIEGVLVSSPNENINYNFAVKNKQIFDSINYAVKSKSRVKPGYSGAPVFLYKPSTKQWIFSGVTSQGITEDSLIFIVKPNYLLSNLKEKIIK